MKLSGYISWFIIGYSRKKRRRPNDRGCLLSFVKSRNSLSSVSFFVTKNQKVAGTTYINKSKIRIKGCY